MENQTPIKMCYKKDSKGKIRVTSYYLYNNGVRILSGLLGGKLKETLVPCKPKNVGRSNETTLLEQSLLELNSRYKKKLDEGYFETVEEAENTVVVLPTLAKSVNLKTLQFPCITSPKLDGMRCMGQSVEGDTVLISRKGKKLDTLKHIKLPAIADAWLDGELYAHGYDFQTNMSMIKKYREGMTDKITYHVYDIYVPNSDLGYIDRHKLLVSLCTSIDNVETVPYKIACSKEDLLDIHKEYLSHGYEGTMVRIDGVPYELNKRSSNLLKFKDFIDETYVIVDVVPNEKTPTHGTVVCQLGDSTFKCGMKMSHEAREEILINKEDYIGKIAEVRFFEYSSTGVPRFPVCVGVREF